MELVSALLLAVLQQSAWTEADFQSCVCAGMEIEVELASGARADCISEKHAIEVESYSDWAEGIGQSLHYGAQSGLRPKLILFCETTEKRCHREFLRLRETVAEFALPIVIEDVADHECLPLELSTNEIQSEN